MDKTERLAQIAKDIEKCLGCELHKTATHPVPGEGNPDADVMFIGEAPGFNEDQQGRPFVGNAGRYLDILLGKAGLSRGEVFIGNLVKFRPPENRDPTPAEIAIGEKWLDQQIETIEPKIIVTLGRFSMNKFLPGVKISEVHGKTFKKGSWVVIPMYHPAAALRSGQVSRQLEEDFLKNKDLLLNPDKADNIIEQSSDGQGSLF